MEITRRSPEGEMPQAEGECVAVSRRYRARPDISSGFRPPPQSLRDSSPSGGAISDPPAEREESFLQRP